MLKVTGSQSVLSEHQAPPLKQRNFKSARLVGQYEKPWIKEKEPRKLWDRMIFYGFLLVGMGISAYVCYDGWRSVPHNNYCKIFEDDFSGGLSQENWIHEVEMGGFGTGSFDWTTTDPANSFVDSDGLHIIPTLTTQTTSISPQQINDGYTVNLTKAGGDGTCTSGREIPMGDCSARSNITSGHIINPVRSARITTRGKHNITYGKIEVEAKLPKGDWLWPAIWTMPEKNTYGEWPASGEIDIMESKGNYGDFYPGGRDEVSGTLHWGPNAVLDLFFRATGKRDLRRTDFSEDFHLFGMEWTEDYIYTYVDSRLAQTLFLRSSTGLGNMWKRGGFQKLLYNYTSPIDTWSQTGRPNTPFDQPFYLILNVAVGGTIGFFPDRLGDKPWLNGSPTAMRDFWNARDAWFPTWGEANNRGMTVKSVKMWREGKCTE